MRILVACEFSGIVRDAFAARGHDAWSCDLLPSETDGPHIEDDVLHRLTWAHWDLMIAFPPCTHLCASGARWWPERKIEQADAIVFVRELLNCSIGRVAIENPVGILSTAIRPPDQIIQPWQFGHGETKATCLWLKNLPPLTATHSERPDFFLPAAPQERFARVHREPPSQNMWRNRSRTYEGIARAMADQWGAR